jgi:hypothetical protein
LDNIKAYGLLIIHHYFLWRESRFHMMIFSPNKILEPNFIHVRNYCAVAWIEEFPRRKGRSRRS